MEPCVIVPLPRTVDRAAVLAPVAGVPPLLRVTRSVLGTAPRARIVVATTPALVADVAECVRQDAVTVIACDPGTRRQVLAEALEHLGLVRDSSAAVLVCDHRHPLSTGAVADRVLAALRSGHDVVVPTLPVTDTIKTVDGLGSVLGTVDRASLRTVQYPRGFAASVLWGLVSGPDDVDEFEAALRERLDVGTVDGDPNAFEVELPRDAPLLDAIIAGGRG